MDTEVVRISKTEPALEDRIREGIEMIVSEGELIIAKRAIKVKKEGRKIQATIGNCCLIGTEEELELISNFAAVQLRNY